MKKFFSRVLTAIAAFLRRVFGRRKNKAPSTPTTTSGERPSVNVMIEPHFDDFDVAAIARELELEKRGREHGRAEQPPGDSDELDPVEQEIRRQLEEAVKDARKQAESVAKAMSLDHRAAQIRATIANLGPTAHNATADMRAFGLVQRGRLVLKAESACGHKRELSRFREENGLTREAHGADGALKRGLIGWGLVAALLIIETVVNGSALASGLYNGLIAGWSIAFGVALLNTLVAFLLGCGARLAFHRRWLFKVCGLLIILAWLAAAMGVNLGVAHFRDALEVDPDNAAAIAVKRIWPPNFAIANFYSILLLCMGGLFSAIAFFDGIGTFGFDDYYPFYGRKARACNIALTRLQKASEDAIRRMTRFKDEKLTPVSRDRSAISGMIADYNEQVHRLDRMRGQMRQQLQKAGETANRLVQIYRKANIAARTAKPPPHFLTPLVLDTSCADFAPSSYGGDEQFEIGDLSDYQNKIIEVFEEIVNSFPKLKDL